MESGQEPVVTAVTLQGRLASEPNIEVIKVIPSKEQIERTLDIENKKLSHLKDSITKGKGDFVGTLGEIVAADFWGLDIVNDGDNWSPHYDLVHPTLKQVDVKSKRQTPATCYSGYEISVWERSRTRQRCDNFLFTRIRLPWEQEQERDFQGLVVWLLGTYPKEQFFKDATFMKKGTKDPKNNFVVRDDCWNLPIYEVIPLDLTGLPNATKPKTNPADVFGF